MNFEVTTSEVHTNEFSGKQTFRPFLYMVRALTFGQAEDLMEQYLQQNESIGTIEDISKSNVSKVDKKLQDYFYKVKITTMEENFENGKMQAVRHYQLISADKPEDAIKKARRRFSPIYGDEYSVDTTSKTPFIDIINY